MTNNGHKLTVLIPTYNEEDLIAQAIKSVLWADEIFVVDSFSTDKTVEIAESYGARVIQRKFTYHADQKNWAIPKSKYDWILVLDSDEVVTDELRDNIKKLLNSGEGMNKYDGYEIARKHFFLKKFLRWGGRYPLYNVRLFKRTIRYEDRNVHEHIILPKDKMQVVDGDMLHYSDRSLSQFFEKFNRYSTQQANYMVKAHESIFKTKVDLKQFFTNGLYTKALIKDVWFFIPGTSFARFVYMYIVRFGFLDGRYGFLIAVLYAFQDYVSKTKYLEMRDKTPKIRLAIQEFITNNCDALNCNMKNDFSLKSNNI
ncbi:MAG: glycosyltransferase family 2 protein [Candidatus Moraniibacteriota bacterium]|jgi:glycosyltransferase involved in cell wall biosynthesis